MREAPTVSILTFCAHPALAYGTLLVFKTLRVGFPTAKVEVLDNGSHPDVVDHIEQAAAAVGATFHRMKPRHYADHYAWLLLERDHAGALVLVDPDVVFWRDIEGWDFGDALAAGRLIPQLVDGNTTSLPRLHPSLFWIPDVGRLRSALGGNDAIGSTVKVEGRRLLFHDTLEPLYAAHGGRMHAFGEEQLDCYDHLFYGSHLPLMAACVHAGFDAISAGHTSAAAGDLEALRGIWRRQDDYFRTVQVTGDRDRATRALQAAENLQETQGMNHASEELSGSLLGLRLRMSQPRRRGAETPK